MMLLDFFNYTTLKMFIAVNYGYDTNKNKNK